MSAGIAADGRLLFLATTAVATLVFLLSIRFGRWPLWTLGYGLMLVALAVVFLFREGAA